MGRLDYDTEGMLILTDDGDLAFRLTHPKNEISKTYLVRIEGTVSESELNKLRGGVELDGKMTGKSNVRIVETVKSLPNCTSPLPKEEIVRCAVCSNVSARTWTF